MSLAIPSNFANAVAPFAPSGRQPVGQETAELRESTLKPLEQLPESARRENRRSSDDSPGEASERQRLDQGSAKSDVSESEGDQNAREQEQARLEELQTQQEIRELASRDREVRLHEQAHAAIGGRHAGTPRYDYERGPDGVNYAVSGEVPINTSKVPNDPQATIEKAQQIRRAAYAPAEPSDTDRRVAAEAAQMEASARAELRQEVREEAVEQNSSQPDQSKTSIDALQQTPTSERSIEQQPAVQLERAETDAQVSNRDLILASGQRNVDSYRQLLDVGTLNEQAALGSRLNQHV